MPETPDCPQVPSPVFDSPHEPLDLVVAEHAVESEAQYLVVPENPPTELLFMTGEEVGVPLPAGISGDSEPTFSENPAQDGTVVWTNPASPLTCTIVVENDKTCGAPAAAKISRTFHRGPKVWVAVCATHAKDCTLRDSGNIIWLLNRG